MGALKVESLAKRFPGHDRPLTVFEDLSLEVQDGEFVCVVGPSGCGKTTLLNIIAGLEASTGGRVLHDGRPAAGVGPERLVIFQDLCLFPWLTVQKNVEFGLKLKGLPAPRRSALAREYLDMVQLDRFRDASIHELSGGMKQRVALARALAIDPEILLMDEPFAALDAQSRDLLHVELQRIWARTRKTIVFVTHNVREAVCLGDRVVVLSSLPARVKAVFPVRLQRPRAIEDPGLMEIVRSVLSELKSEVDKVQREELSGGA